MARKDRRITAEDLWKIERPSQPTLSPDGAQACISVSRYDMAENKGRSSLWLLSTFGGAARQLTQVGDKDGEPAWSPDGRLIAFVAKRGDDEEPQVYVIAPDGGEARRVTTMPTGASGIRWFPDSRRIAFISWVWPDAKALDVAKLAKRYKAFKDDKVKAHVVEHMSFRFWDHWISDGRVPHLVTVEVASGKMRDLFAGTAYELPRADTSAMDYDIAPDGREVAFSHDPKPDKRFDNEFGIVTLDLRRRRFTTLAPRSALSLDNPVYSPDGRSLAVMTRNIRRSAVGESRIASIDRASGKLSAFPWSWDRSVAAPLAWTEGSDALVFHADDRARTNLYRWTLGERNPVVIVQGGTVSEFAVRGGSTVFIRNSMSTPSAAFALGADGTERRLDTFNDARMAKFRLGQVEEHTVKGFGGEDVQMWVIYPPDFDPKRRWPLLHNIHGGPHSTWGDNFHFRWNNHVFAAQGYVVACVNYHGSSSFGQKWVESIMDDKGRREHADIEAGTDHLLKKGFIDAKRLVAAGGSYGGYMVAWMNGHASRYKAYVCHAGCFDWVSMFADDVFYWHERSLGAYYFNNPKKVDAQNPRTHMGKMNTPTLVTHGALDYRVPDGQGLAYYNSLKAKGVDARLVFFPDENHWILKPQNSRLWYKEFFAWLARYVKPGGLKN